MAAPQQPQQPQMLPQPDFEQISDGIAQLSSGLGDLSVQFRRCGNLPAVAGGADILAAIAAMQRQMTEGFQRLETRIEHETQRLETRIQQETQRLETRIQQEGQQLGIRMAALNSNATACRLNDMAKRPGSSLQPLVALATNQPIDGFPETLGSIDGMTGAALGVVLRALEQPSTGTLAEKRNRLRIAIGVTTVAVSM